jgi:hypothetical protein
MYNVFNENVRLENANLLFKVDFQGYYPKDSLFLSFL